MRYRAGNIALSVGYVLAAVAAMIILSGKAVSAGKDSSESKVVFAVHCYDDGAKALKGMPGVIRIEKGRRNFQEIDTVYFDPTMTTIETMENVLKQAGTYRETIR